MFENKITKRKQDITDKNKFLEGKIEARTVVHGFAVEVIFNKEQKSHLRV